jgi:C-terminal processing protease CtpA/Prc
VIWVVALVLLPATLSNAQQAPSAVPAAPATSAPVAPGSSTPATQPAQGSISKTDRERALGILDTVVKGIRENYYDPKTNGVNWDAVLANARAKIAQANSLNAALAQVAAAVDTLNDSHTVFYPPYRPYKLDFGLQYQMVWSRCVITHVRPGSDAAAKGVRPGAEVLRIDGVVPKRQNLWSIEYLVQDLDPQPELALELQYPSGEKAERRRESERNASFRVRGPLRRRKLERHASRER